MSLLKNMKHA